MLLCVNALCEELCPCHWVLWCHRAPTCPGREIHGSQTSLGPQARFRRIQDNAGSGSGIKSLLSGPLFLQLHRTLPPVMSHSCGDGAGWEERGGQGEEDLSAFPG